MDGIPLTHKSTDINAVRAEVGMVFQQFNLFPHLTARKTSRWRSGSCASATKTRRIGWPSELLERVGIPEKADSFPGQLSGGQQQRVAIAAGAGDGSEDHALRRADERARSRR